MGPSTTRSSSPRHVDGRLTERSADCSTAFLARATPVRPYELPSRHVSRHHDTLAVSTTYCRLTYCTSSWPFNCLPREWHQSVRVSRRHETSPSPRSIDIWPTIVQPTTTSTSLRSNVFWCRWDYATDGHISYRSTQPSRMTRRVLLILCFTRHASVTIFCLFWEHCIISVNYAFLLVTNLLTLMSIISFAPFQLGFDLL